jgi:hypothetical protein
LGEHTWAKKGVEMPEFVAGQPFDRARKVRVWRVEEKKTDVNLALAMYRDETRPKAWSTILCWSPTTATPSRRSWPSGKTTPGYASGSSAPFAWRPVGTRWDDSLTGPPASRSLVMPTGREATSVTTSWPPRCCPIKSLRLAGRSSASPRTGELRRTGSTSLRGGGSLLRCQEKHTCRGTRTAP